MPVVNKKMEKNINIGHRKLQASKRHDTRKFTTNEYISKHVLENISRGSIHNVQVYKGSYVMIDLD